MASIAGRVFSDFNNNGVQEANEPGLANWNVYLDANDNGNLDAGERSAVTGATGAYLFDDLTPQQYVVREVLQPGYTQSIPGTGGIILSSPGGGAGGGSAPASGPSGVSPTEIVVAFKGAHGKGRLKQNITADPNLARLVNYSASSDLFTVRDVTLVTVKLSPGTKPRAAVDAFKRLGTVKWAQVNYTYAGDRRELSPSDPQYPNQYHHPLMQNNLAWDITQGDPRVVVAITDDGADTEHEDLYRNIWVNQAEIPALRRASLTDVNGDGYISMDELNDPANRGAFKANDVNADGRITAADLLAPMVKDGGGNDTGAGGWSDGIDEGNNGYADDITGRDFWSNDNDTRETGFDTHGTHVTGIAAARTDNGVGVAGTAGRISVMPIRFWASVGNIWTSTIVSNAYRYAADNGAKILSTSYNMTASFRTTFSSRRWCTCTTTACCTLIPPATAARRTRCGRSSTNRFTS
jgi:hypothetical protein